MVRKPVSGLVVFDWNGTIVDDVERAALATEIVLSRRGGPVFRREEFRDRFRLPLGAFFTELGVERHDLVEAEAEWSEALGRSKAPLSAGVPAMLEALLHRGVRLGVVSAAAQASVLLDARAGGVAELFDFVDGGRSDKSAVLRELAAAHDGWMAYVGDTEYDMASAIAAGAHPIGYGGGYRPGESLRQAGASVVIEEMSQLPRVLDSLLLH